MSGTSVTLPPSTRNFAITRSLFSGLVESVKNSGPINVAHGMDFVSTAVDLIRIGPTLYKILVLDAVSW